MTKPRKFRVGYPHHIYNRGNRKDNVYLKPKDYNVFIKQLYKYSKEFECEILGYCVMPNHYHLILQPLLTDSIPKVMHRLSIMYAKYLRKEYGWVGHVFQGRYQSKLVKDDVYYKKLVEYIKQNPAEADLVRNAEDYRWLKIFDEKILIQKQIFNPG